MAVITNYLDENGAAVQRTDYSQPPKPVVVTDVRHEYKPMEPEEAMRWAVYLGRLCLAGAIVMTALIGMIRLSFKENSAIQSSVFAGIAFPSLWLAAFSVPSYVLIDAYRRRRRYEDSMINRFAPAPAEDEVEDDETDDAPRMPDAPTPSDTMYDKCVAVLTYAFNRGGTAPVPRTTRNGTASLLLVTGGTLDGNDYPAVAALLRDRYGLMTGGDGKPWKLTQGWPSEDDLLDAFDAAFDRRALGLE